VLRQKWLRGQVEARLGNLPPCLIGMEASVGAHHLSRKLQMLGHDARLMPAKYVRPYSKGQKNDFRDAEAIAEAVNVFLYAEDAKVDAAIAVVTRLFEQGKLPREMRIGRAIYEDEQRRNWHFQPVY